MYIFKGRKATERAPKKKEEKKRHHFLYRLIVPFLMPILLLFVCLIFLSKVSNVMKSVSTPQIRG
jgi:hypothetical protein